MRLRSVGRRKRVREEEEEEVELWRSVRVRQYHALAAGAGGGYLGRPPALGPPSLALWVMVSAHGRMSCTGEAL